MSKSSPSRETIEAEAMRLGAKPAAVFKWRTRGVPAHWKVKLMEFGAMPFKPHHFAVFGRANTEAAE